MFNFKTLIKTDKPNEPKVFVDSQEFNPKQSYKDVKELLIENQYGKVKIENCRISNLTKTEFAEIKRYSVCFNEKFKRLNQEKQNFFIKTTIQIELVNIAKEELEIEELTDYLLALGAIRKKPENQNHLVFTMNTFQDIDLADFFSDYKKQKMQLEAIKKEQSNSKLELNIENLQRLKQLNFGETAAQGAKKFKDENGKENFYAVNNLNTINKADLNLLKQQNLNFFEERKNANSADNVNNYYINNELNFPKNQIKRPEAASGFENVFDFSDDNFIPFEESKDFDFKYNKNVNPNPYALAEKSELHKYRKSMRIYGMKPCFNQFGEFTTIGKFNAESHSFNLNINKIIPNKNLITDKNLKLINATKIQQANQFGNSNNINKYIADENMSELNDISIDEASIKTDDYANANLYNKNLLANQTSNYEAALLQEYPVQTICNFLELLKAKLKQIHKDRNFIEEINNLNLNSKTFKLNKKESSQQQQQRMDIESESVGHNEEISNPQFLKVLLKNKIDDCLDVNDYTKIVWDYLVKLMKAKDKFSNLYKCEANSEIIINLEKEISTLKLFASLFLNCFYDLKQINNPSYSNNFTNNFSKNLLMLNFSHSNLPETQRLRKKKLLDWLAYDCRNAKFIEEQLNEKAKKIANLEKKETQNNLYKLIFYCLINGRIKKALELTNRFNLFNLSGLISQFYMNNSLNNVRCYKEQILKETWNKQNDYLNFIYEILTVESTKSNISKKPNNYGLQASDAINGVSNATNLNNENNIFPAQANIMSGNVNFNVNQPSGDLFGNAANIGQSTGLFGSNLNPTRSLFGSGNTQGTLFGVNANQGQTSINNAAAGLFSNAEERNNNLFVQGNTGLVGNLNSNATRQSAGGLFGPQTASSFTNINNPNDAIPNYAINPNSNNIINNPNSNVNYNNDNYSADTNLFYDEKILENLNWKQFFICNGLYCMKATQNIDDMVENYSNTVKNLSRKYPNIDSYLVSNNCQDINMLLLEYYTMIQKEKEYDEEFLNKIFLQKNIFSKYSDLHMHFIICTILLNTLSETYTGNNSKNLGNDLFILKNIQLKLLLKLTENLLIQGNILAAVNLILISNISNSNKLNLVEEIIYRYINTENQGLNTSSTNLKIFEQINAKATFDALGIRSLSLFDIEKALKHFKLSENYEKLHEVKLKYFMLFNFNI